MTSQEQTTLWSIGLSFCEGSIKLGVRQATYQATQPVCDLGHPGLPVYSKW